MSKTAGVLCLLLLALPAAAQDKKGKPAPGDKVDPVKVDAAIKKGLAYLKGQIGHFGTLNKRRSDELILWTFTHGGLQNDTSVASCYSHRTSGVNQCLRDR